MSTSSELTAQVGTAVAELNNAKNRFEAIRAETDQKVDTKVGEMEAWKAAAFSSAEAKSHTSPGSRNVIDLKHLSDALFYPILLQGSSERINVFEVSRCYSRERAAGLVEMALFLKFEVVSYTWGGNPIRLMVNACEQRYREGVGALGFANYYRAMVFLRGGYEYDLWSNNANQKFTVYENKTTYYQDLANPQYDSTVGPIDDAAVAAVEHTTNLGMADVFYQLHSPNIGNLGA